MNKVSKERFRLLRQIEDVFETPMVILGFVWLILLVIELVRGLHPFLENLGYVIWGLFVVDFIIKFVLAPSKPQFLKSNFLTVISLIIPAFRVLRIFRLVRLLRFSRGLRLVKVLGTLNRGMRALSATMKRRAFGYIMLLTLIVIFAGAAGMYAFEKDVEQGLSDFGTSLWWTTMIITTLGSEYWPKTLEGRVLCVFLSLYAFAVFGYITATIATFFIGRDAEGKSGEIAGANQIDELRKEILSLKQMVNEISRK